MVKTLQYHLQHEGPGSQRSKYRFRSLLGMLNTMPPQFGIDIVLGAIANETIKFRSIYDRAYRLYHLSTDNIMAYNQSTSEVHQMTARAIIQMKEILPPLPLPFRDMIPLGREIVNDVS